MKHDSYQPARLYGTAKTHKFETFVDITVAKLKFRSVIDQTGMFMYNAAKAILDYLRPLCKNEYSINDTQKFPTMLSSIPPLQDDEEEVSYDVSHYLQIFRYKKESTILLNKLTSWHQFIRN